METLALQDDVIHRAAQLIARSIQRQADYRAGVTYALDALHKGDTLAAVVLLQDLLDAQ